MHSVVLIGEGAVPGGICSDRNPPVELSVGINSIGDNEKSLK